MKCASLKISVKLGRISRDFSQPEFADLPFAQIPELSKLVIPAMNILDNFPK
jgi:hypothetical protein